MVKFNKLKKLKLITAMTIFIKYSLWSIFFIFQGKAIDIAVTKNALYKQLIYVLGGFILVKIIVMLCDIFQKFIAEYYKNIELKYQWKENFPKRIYRDIEGNESHINILFFDYIPRLFDLENSINAGYVTIICIFSLTIITFIYTGFLIGVVALLLVFFLNQISKNIYIQKIDEHHGDANNRKIQMLRWVSQYFNSYKEISRNWTGITTFPWSNQVYQKYYTARNKQIFFHLYRDLLSQILVELPFLLNTSVVILGVYYGYLSVTQMFVWVGFSQFMINASNAYLENRVNKRYRITLNRQSTEILSTFQQKKLEYIENNPVGEISIAEVTMRDGSKNHVSVTPGIYRIRGGNGSGKSTLLNIISGYEREYRMIESINFSKITRAINYNCVRLIARDAIIFDCIDDFNIQVCGPLSMDASHWSEKITKSTGELLGLKLADKWINIFFSLESEYLSRSDKVMSSGEKVILSFMRFFFSWNSDVNLLVIDECDSFLDQEKKELFIEAVNSLSTYMAVYISSHHIHGLERTHLMVPSNQ